MLSGLTYMHGGLSRSGLNSQRMEFTLINQIQPRKKNKILMSTDWPGPLVNLEDIAALTLSAYPPTHRRERWL